MTKCKFGCQTNLTPARMYPTGRGALADHDPGLFFYLETNDGRDMEYTIFSKILYYEKISKSVKRDSALIKLFTESDKCEP